VVWISKSNRSALKEKERPGSDAGPFCISLHVDLDDDNCMEVTALKGSSGDLQHFADRIFAERGVRYGRVAMIPTSAKTNRCIRPGG
jgi:hypothetical protein